MNMSGQNPLVSVLVPIYGVETYIERCAHSLFQQTLEDIEFIFVNDCTQDKSMIILERVIAEYPHRKIKIINHQKNLGLAGARKTGFENASGKYWICCDSDDWVAPNMYEQMLKRAEENGADIVCCGLYKETSLSELVHYEFNRDTIENILNPQYFGWVHGAIWNKLVKASLYRDNNIVPWLGINMWEDSCLTLRLRLLSKNTVIMNECFYHYNVQNSNSITYNFNRGKVLQMIDATTRIEEFLDENGFKTAGSSLLKYLKVMCKEVLLRYPTKENVELFKESFPEVTSYFVVYPRWNTFLKVRALLVMFLPTNIATRLLMLFKKK